MAKEATNVDVEQALEKLAAQPPTPAAGTRSGESRELWRVISADGSTRLFETTPTAHSPTNRPLKGSKAAVSTPAHAAKSPAASSARGRLVTPLRREAGHDEKISLAELFEAAAARQPLAKLATPRPESKVAAKSPPARGGKRTAIDSSCVATVLSTGDLPPIDAQPVATLASAGESPVDADLKKTVDAWPFLSPGTRAAIVAMVRAASAERTAAN